MREKSYVYDLSPDWTCHEFEIDSSEIILRKFVNNYKNATQYTYTFKSNYVYKYSDDTAISKELYFEILKMMEMQGSDFCVDN